MRILSLLVLSILLSCINSFAQYDDGTEIFMESSKWGTNIIQKLYKVDDFNRDGYIDIIMIKPPKPQNNRYNLTWYKNNAGETFSEQTSLLHIEVKIWIDDIFIEDINKDGTTDIIFQNNDTGLTILKNDGYGNIYEQIDNEVVTEDSINIDLKEIADMDGDGDVDYIFGSGLIGHNNGSGLISGYEYIDSNINKNFSNFQAVDIDGDGGMDIIALGHNSIFIYENLQENGFMLKQEFSVFPQDTINALTSIISLKLQDIDNDSNCELLVETAKSDFSMDGHTFFISHTPKFWVLDYDIQKEVFFTLEVYDSWLHNYIIEIGPYNPFLAYNEFQVQYGHYNQDNNLDALSVNVPQGKLLWYLGDGKGGFESDQSQIVHASNQYSTRKPALQLTDVDNDGDLDVFVLLNTDTLSTLTLFKNEALVSTANNNFVLGKMGITPNPVSGNSYIQLNLSQNQYFSKATYNIYTIEGSKLITGSIKDSRIYIPDLTEGIYLVEISTDGKNYINKLIVN